MNTLGTGTYGTGGHEGHELQSEIRNTNIEIRDKFKSPKYKIQNKKRGGKWFDGVWEEVYNFGRSSSKV